MYEDVPIANMPNKVRVIELVNENVIPIILKQKFKKGSFYCPFFLSIRKSLVMKEWWRNDEGFGNVTVSFASVTVLNYNI